MTEGEFSGKKSGTRPEGETAKDESRYINSSRSY